MITSDESLLIIAANLLEELAAIALDDDRDNYEIAERFRNRVKICAKLAKELRDLEKFSAL